VIEFAGDIFTGIMERVQLHEIMAPNLGLKDGIIRQIWKEHFQD
jgi:hypothetical protein